MQVEIISDDAVCIKIDYRGLEISIATDNSCGAMDSMARCSLAIFNDNNEYVSSTIIPGCNDKEIYYVDGGDLYNVFKAIDVYLDFD